MTLITRTAKKTELGYKSRICVYENDKFLWQVLGRTNYVHQRDAYQEANKMAVELEGGN